ncbi:hypothetical protein CJ030_MR2G005724 [Morella rubra]|uniref:Uncharacterized protein n=1 Tax=Morella rubra TaxID=262757 RepID=A0A6A1WHB8_9ROSI|nr:hypothetical protein CJ030_MR2G005724 [Morella rubra]
MGCDSHAWEDRCRDEAPVAPMGTLDTPTACATRAPQPCHGISARARKLSTHDKAWPQQRPCQACQPASHRHAMTRCHNKSLDTSQAKQEQRANRQRSAKHGWPPPATTSGGAPPPLPVLGGNGRGRFRKLKEHHHPWRCKQAAARCGRWRAREIQNSWRYLRD